MCPQHETSTFRSLLDYHEHLERDHVGNSSSAEKPPINTHGRRRCPICLEEGVEFEHIGSHLLAIAMFSLPKLADFEDDLDGTSEVSQIANLESSETSLSKRRTTASLPSLPEETETDPSMPLAAAMGDKVTVQQLLANGRNINAVHEIYGTALQAAASHGQNVIVRALLESGADANISKSSLPAPLYIASTEGDETMARMLLDYGADVNEGGERGTPVEVALEMRYDGLVKLFLSSGAAIDIEALKANMRRLKRPAAWTEVAEARISATNQKSELREKIQYSLKIKPQYHRDLIGEKGSQIKRLQDQYGVRIEFPRTAKEKASEASGHRSAIRHQALDEVNIYGSKQGADEARDEILGILQNLIEASHSSSIFLQQSHLLKLIGHGSKDLKSIQETSGAKIDVEDDWELFDPSSLVEIKIKGTKSQVEKATRFLQVQAKLNSRGKPRDGASPSASQSTRPSNSVSQIGNDFGEVRYPVSRVRNSSDGFSFVFRIDHVEPNFQAQGRQSYDDGGWKPPTWAVGLRTVEHGRLYRWQSGVASPISQTDAAYTAIVQNPVGYQYSTATVFTQAPSSQEFLAVNFDARWKNIDPDHRWEKLMFRHVPSPAGQEYYYSDLGIGSLRNSHFLATLSNADWQHDLFPAAMHCDGNHAFANGRRNAGLIGELPYLLAVIAFSGPRQNLLNILHFCLQSSQHLTLSQGRWQHLKRQAHGSMLAHSDSYEIDANSPIRNAKSGCRCNRIQRPNCRPAIS